MSVRCLEGFQRVSEKCLKVSWRVSVRCYGTLVEGVCMEAVGMMRVSGDYEKGVWKVSNILGPKFFGTKNFLGPKLSWTQNFLDYIFFGPSKFLCPILDLIYFDPKIIIANNFWFQIFFSDPKIFNPNFFPKKISPNIFEPKIVLGQKNFVFGVPPLTPLFVP